MPEYIGLLHQAKQGCEDLYSFSANELLEACYSCLEDSTIDCADIFDGDDDFECSDINNQDECERFAEYTIHSFSRKAKVNGVWRGLESISHFSLLKTTWKNEILGEMGFFPIKSKLSYIY